MGHIQADVILFSWVPQIFLEAIGNPMGHVLRQRCAHLWRCTNLSYVPICGNVPNSHICPYIVVGGVPNCHMCPYMVIYLPNCHICPNMVITKLSHMSKYGGVPNCHPCLPM